MRDLERRVKHLEAQCQTGTHVISIVRYPWDLDDADLDGWLQDLRCPCGVVGCPELRIGALVSDIAPSAEAWAAYWQERQRTHDAAAEAARWLRRYTGEDGDGS